MCESLSPDEKSQSLNPKTTSRTGQEKVKNKQQELSCTDSLAGDEFCSDVSVSVFTRPDLQGVLTCDKKTSI